MAEKKYIFELKMSVRHYECDFQSIVNNAIYQNYLEYTRHLFLKSIGIDFEKMHLEGKDLVVSRVEIDYRFPLRSGDRFIVKLNLSRKGKLRFIFHQDIYLLPEEKPVLNAVVTGVCLQNGRPCIPDEVVEVIENTI